MSTTASPHTPADGSRAGRPVRIGALMVALLAASFAFQLNASMLSPALATMADELDTTASAVGVTQTAFFTAAALFSLFLPRLGDLIGRRKVLTGMMVLMAVGCVISALAGSVGMLAVGRVIQGASGPTIPLALIMLRVEVPDPKKYGTLMGVVTAVNGGIAGVDSFAGGSLAEHAGYASIFWVMTAFALVAALLVRLFAPESRAELRPPMDWPGVALLVVSVGALLIAFNEAGKLGDANWPLAVGLLVLAGLAFWAFWRMETRAKHPLVTTGLLKRRATWSLLLSTMLTMTGVFAIMNGLLPGFAQDTSVGLGLGAEGATWWTLTPYALAGLAMGPVSGRLAATYGYGRILRVGLIATAVATVLALLTLRTDSSGLLLTVSILLGVTYAGTVNIMLNGFGIVLSPKENPGFLPGLNAGCFNLGAGLSFVVLYAAMDAVAPSGGTSVGGYSAGVIAGLVLIVAALLVSTLIPKPVDAEAAG
ncbi:MULTISPECIES: MFS transporter [unclassified Streptomyces]|uniref:uridine transporter UriT n=1 Tax=unclassified Streptomyces TaxID=2593676 RepID=UPI000DB9E0D6|nr:MULTISPECIES: MFS transporter [unclassified Streptomyces]MYT71620.1 MFS transporter [Streptomyces sp. SID8367]RAJ72870.1 MFS transporter [Streptomyces sp. PsTaAH-137]